MPVSVERGKPVTLPDNISRTANSLLGIRWIFLVGLVEQEVGSQLLVLIASEVGLDGLIAVEAQAT